MAFDFSSTSLIYFLTGTITLVTTYINWRQRKKLRGSYLAIAMMFVTEWAFAGGLESAAVGINHKMVWVVVGNVAGGGMMTMLMLFVMDEYHPNQWIPKNRHWLLFIPIFIFFLIQITNPWHHLVWTDLVADAPEDNLLLMKHGPAYYVAILYGFIQLVIALVILARNMIISTGRSRYRSAQIIFSFTIPFISWLMFLIWSNNRFALDIMPIGFAACGLLISYVIFEDLQYQVLDRTLELQDTVESLQKEIEARQQLETVLRGIQDSLAEQLADQSQKLSGLYNIILISGQALDSAELMEKSLDIIQSVTGAEAVCYFQRRKGRLILENQRNLTPKGAAALRLLPDGWMRVTRDVRADIDHSPDLPDAFLEAGYRSSLSKIVFMQHKPATVLSIFWSEPRRMGVEEIALFGALADALSIVLENTRLRREAADAAADAARVQERRRLARDLHDSVTQSLHSFVYSAETARQYVHSQPERADRALDHLMRSARQALKEMRLLLYELRLVPVEEIGFLDALRSRLDAVEKRANVDVDITVEPDVEWNPAWESELYPIVIEALNNSLKHSGATRVQICLSGAHENFMLEITDNGCGFVPEEVNPGGMGMRTMAERAEKINAQIEVRSAPGGGTCVRLHQFAEGSSKTNNGRSN